MSEALPRVPAWGPDGLVPVVVQDAADGRVLMVAYTDAEALAATLATGDVHFHSRSRGALWRKGETSGNTLRLVRLDFDCDADAILATVRPVGPTCHLGTRSCFDPGPDVPAATVPGAAEPTVEPVQDFAWLERLWATIADRRRRPRPGSYTAALLAGGVDATARKVVEEATEVVLAAKDDAAAEGRGVDRGSTREALAGEAADLLYHALVLLAERDLEPAAVIAVLRERHRA